MSKKLAVILLMAMLGMASWDAFLDHDEWSAGVAGDDELVSVMLDGTGKPPLP